MLIRALIAGIFTVTLLGAHSAAAQQPTTPAPPPSTPASASTAPLSPDAAARVAKVRAQAEARKNARRVRVKLLDGGIATGRVVGVTDRDMAVQPTPSDEPVLLAYEAIDSINGPGMPRWALAALVGAGLAAGVAILAAAD